MTMPRDLSFHLLPIVPIWWIVLITLGLLVLLGIGCRMLAKRNVPRQWIAILGIVRVLIVAVFAICMLHPVIAYRTSQEQQSSMIVMVDTSRSMAKGARLETATAALRDGAIGKALREQYDVHWYAFGRSAAPIKEDNLATLTPEGSETRLAESIDAAWRHHTALMGRTALAGGEPPRMLIVSDGNDLSDRSASTTAQEHGLTIDVMPPPAEEDPTRPPLRIINVQAPPRVLKGAETRFAVSVRREGGKAMELPIKLLDEGKAVGEGVLTFEADRHEARVVLTHKPGEAGVRRYTVELPTAEAVPFSVAVRVVDDEHEVLILEDRWRWEFRYLRRILEGDPGYHLSAMMSRGDNAYVQFGEPTRRVELGGYPQGSAETNWFDIIVLGDTDPSRWPPELAEAITEGVTRRGKSVVFIVGPNIEKLARHPKIGPLLPVEVSQRTATPIEGMVQVRVSDEAAASTLFASSPESLLPPQASQLPPLDYLYPVLRKRPGATVLLESVDQANEYGPLIVMAEQRVGRGRTMLISTDTLWKWQMSGPITDNDQTLYKRFWQQAFRVLTPTQSASGQSVLWVSTDQTRLSTGSSAQLYVQLDPPAAEATYEAVVIDPDGERSALSLDASPEAPGAMVGSMRMRKVGGHRIDVTVSMQGDTLATASTAIEGIPGITEDDDTGVNTAGLTALAQATGGVVIDAENPESWPTAGREPGTFEVEREGTFDLWNNFALMLVLCALLGTDWMLRLMRGYV